MDHCDAEKRKRNPRETTNIFSLFTFMLCSVVEEIVLLITFRYTGELFGKSLKKDLEEDDLYEVIKGCSSKRCGDKMEKQWQIETKTHATPSIYRLMWSRYGRRYLLLGFIDLTFRVFNRCLIFLTFARLPLVPYNNFRDSVMPPLPNIYIGLIGKESY
nr:unnamed protein product [Callosobruchus analis]